MAKKAPKGTKLTKEFLFKLTKEERGEKATAACALDVEISELEARFDEVKKDWKAKIEAREATRRDISALVNAGEEKRTVEATMVKNFDTKVVEYWVETDGEWDLIESAPMTEADYQTELKLDRPKRGRQKKDAKHDPVAEAHANGKDTDVTDVVREETSKRTKHSAVDGATA